MRAGDAGRVPEHMPCMPEACLSTAASSKLRQLQQGNSNHQPPCQHSGLYAHDQCVWYQVTLVVHACIQTEMQLLVKRCIEV
jgi:hypothetical protein